MSDPEPGWIRHAKLTIELTVTALRGLALTGRVFGQKLGTDRYDGIITALDRSVDMVVAVQTELERQFPKAS